MKTTRDAGDHVRVCCRVRPLNANEKQMYKDLCVDYPGKTTDRIECSTHGASETGTTTTATTTATAGAFTSDTTASAERHSFTFSRVFRPEAGQADVYDHVARPIVADVMAGYNGTIFMYGQTGSGKTHTMFGDMKGGAWTAAAVKGGNGGEEAAPSSSTRPSTVMLPAEYQNEEEGSVEMGGADQQQHDDGSATNSDVEDENEEEDDDDFEEGQNEEAVQLPSAASGSSFCRTGATVTPLGELRQINTLQSSAGMAAFRAKSTAKAARPSLTPSSAAQRKLPRAHHTSTQQQQQQRRHRAAVAKDTLSGVIPRAVQDIFKAIADADPSTEFDVQMFFVEVYMEQIRDLLVPASAAGGGSATTNSRRPARKLQLREDVSTNSFYIDGCRMPHVSSAREVLQLVKTGLKHRATSATAMNETSSRSHCLLNLTVKSVNHTQCVSMVGKLYLVDLAGSEKVGKTNATGLRLEEAKLINKSLSTLGMVINSLTDHSATHTPYRNSVLTKILKDSLGGNSHTALVICCSPSPYNAQETLSTLRFGARAKAIENNAVVNRELTAAQLKRMLDSAKDEIERLHSKLRLLTGGDKASGKGGSGSSGSSSGVNTALYDSYAALNALSAGSAPEDGRLDVPPPSTRKLSSASTASTLTASGQHGATAEEASRVSALLEERASEQARLLQLRAEVAQLQDNAASAQETIAALQEERDNYVDRLRSFHDEIQVWEAAHHEAQRRAATQAALLQQCTLLLHTQASEIRDLTAALKSYAAPLAEARAAVDSLNACVFGPDVPCPRRRTLITAEETITAAAAAVEEEEEKSCNAVRAASEMNAFRPSTCSPVPEPQSPNPRRQLEAEMGDVSIVLPQTSRSQQLQGPHTEGRLSGASLGLSPALAAAQEWLSRAASVEPHRREGSRCSADHSHSPRSSVQAQCVLRLEEQLASLSAAHATLQQEHRNALAELQSKQRILDMRRGRLENVTEELRQACSTNEELRACLEKERRAVRAPLEMARNDANYWRRRYEEMTSRREGPPPQSLPRPSELARGSLRFHLPPSGSDMGEGVSSNTNSGGGNVPSGTGEERHGASASAASFAATAARARLSFPGTPSRATTSCRGSGEDILLSLSSHSTPLRAYASFPHVAPLSARPSVAEGGKTTVAFAENRAMSPLRPRSSSRSVSPSAGSKL